MTRKVQISSSGDYIVGDLAIPVDACGVILFAHGSGSGRLSPRNQAVAEIFNRCGFATLLVDLLTAEEELEDRATGHLRFDISLLAGRVHDATRFLQSDRATSQLPIGFFG